MIQSKFDKEMEVLISNKMKTEVPAFFSNGIKNVLGNLPSNEYIMSKETKKKWRGVQVAVAFGLLTAGIIVSSMASPAMAEVLKSVPGLSYIYSVTYKTVNEKTQPQNTISGSQYDFGENGPFNTGVEEVKSFDGYTEEFKNYIGMQIPELKSEEGYLSIRVDKYNEGQFEIHASNEDGVLNVVTNPINFPSFEGSSAMPVVKNSVELHGVKAEVLSYRFSKTDPNDQTNYVVWKRNGLLFIFASTLNSNELIEKAKEIDNQLLPTKNN